MATAVDLTFIGRRLTNRDVLAYFYVPVGTTGPVQGYAKPLISGLKIGTIVRIQQETDGAYFSRGENGPRAIGQEPDSPYLLTWSVEQEADVATHAQAAESKRVVAAGVDPIRTALEPVRAALSAMSPARKAATIGWVISFLQSGKGR